MSKKPTPAPAPPENTTIDNMSWELDESEVIEPVDVGRMIKPTAPEPKPELELRIKPQASTNDFDMEGLMTDFPTAKELERFVYDQTGVVLNLKGRANKLKYQVALDVLNGADIDPVFIGSDNPYLDRADMVPEDPVKPTPPRDPSLPTHEHIQNQFYSPVVPHPDKEYRQRGRKCHVEFRKYNNGMISYEIIGPLEKYPVGNKIDKYGRERPEIIRYNDPRSGEQVLVRTNGELTPIGKRLKPMMQSLKINNTNYWDMWIDRDFGAMNRGVISDPWDADDL